MTTTLERLRAALPAAMRSRDAVAVSALRGALAAVGNAEAVDPADHEHLATSSSTGSEHVAGAQVGVGAAEVARRDLTERDVRQVVAAEAESRTADAAVLDAHGQADQAGRLRAEAAVLQEVLDATA